MGFRGLAGVVRLGRGASYDVWMDVFGFWASRVSGEVICATGIIS